MTPGLVAFTLLSNPWMIMLAVAITGIIVAAKS